jgi:non-heme Fe2+,alpha-ketoglutarate-dependent halogenase
MTTTLSASQLARYEDDGCLFPLPVLTAAEVAQCRGELEALEARLGGKPRPIGLAHLFFRWAHDLALHPRVLDAVEAVLGPDLLVNGGLILCKYPHDPAFVAWHQDGTYSGLHATPNTSAWIALSPSTAANGCMRVIPGSHRRGMMPHLNTYAPQNLLGHGEEIQVAVDESQALAITLAPGEMSLHHSNIVHGSQPSRSDVKRIGFIVRYVTPRLAQSDLPLLRARGAADCGHLPLLASPPIDDAGAVDAWREFIGRRAERHRRADGAPGGAAGGGPAMSHPPT